MYHSHKFRAELLCLGLAGEAQNKSQHGFTEDDSASNLNLNRSYVTSDAPTSQNQDVNHIAAKRTHLVTSTSQISSNNKFMVMELAEPQQGGNTMFANQDLVAEVNYACTVTQC